VEIEMTTLVTPDPPHPDVETLYAALGRFIARFEHVNHAMNSVIGAILEENGLRDYKLAMAVLAGLSAEPLRRNFEAILAHVISSDLAEREIIVNVIGRIGVLAQRRNDIVHRTWFIGSTDSDNPDYSRATSIKFRKGKHGAGPDFLDLSVTEFNALSMEADELTRLVRDIGNSIISRQPLASRFTRNANGTVLSLEGATGRLN
jgi:hypothetical protein